MIGVHSHFHSVSLSLRLSVPPSLNTRRTAPFFVAGILLAAAGCSDGKVIVRGAATVDGQPIAEGSISLEPADGQGPTTGGMIKAGQYELSGDAAAIPGEKIVRIVGLRETGKMVAAGPPAPKGTLIPELVQCVPPQYNDKSELRATVTPGKPNTHDFHLQSKPKASQSG